MIQLSFALVLGLFATSLYADECADNLSALEMSRPGTLRNAVLVLDQKGQHRFITGSYFFGSHRGLVWQAHLTFGVKEILYMGEVRVDVSGDKPVVYDANDTAGHSIVLKTRRAKNLGRSVPLPLEERFPFKKSDIDRLPVAFLARTFWPQRYANGTPAHLSEILNRDEPDEANNFRHLARTGMQAITGLVKIASMHPDHVRVQGKIRELRDKYQKNLTTASDVLTYFTSKDELDSANVELITRAVRAIETLDIQTLGALDYPALEAEVNRLLALDFRSYTAPKD